MHASMVSEKKLNAPISDKKSMSGFYSVGRTLGLNNSAVGRPFRVRYDCKCLGRTLTTVPSFTASCEGRTFGDEKGCRAARCDGVKTRNLLFRFLPNSVQEWCSYHAASFSVSAWRPTRRDFWPATLMQFNAAVKFLFYSEVTHSGLSSC